MTLLKNQSFLLNKEKLNYVFDSHKFINNFEEECDNVEIPSIFYLNLKYEGEIYLPATIFQNSFTPFQIIIKYLRDDLNLSNKQVALLLNRDLKTTWAVYKSIKDKSSLLFKESPFHIPLSIFKDKRLSAFEALVNFLKNLDLTYAEIARLLNKDQRTIWTIHSRIKNKMQLEENER